MHASEAFINEAFINGAARKCRPESVNNEDLKMINTLLSGAAVDPDKPSPDERKAEHERKQESATKSGGFKNDPDDASNPNEVRERHLKKVQKQNP